MLAIIDYQMGNLRSVQKGFERVGCSAEISSDPEVIRRADKIVLPGVGAFEDAISELKRRNLIDPIRESIDRGRPFLGICLGLQLLMDVSHENGRHEGLGVIPGEVVRFDVPRDLKVPHMGWNEANRAEPHPLWEGIADGSRFYFVHSYYVEAGEPSLVAAFSVYGIPFTCAVAKDNIFAVQFHPEKSAQSGLALLGNFMRWKP